MNHDIIIEMAICHGKTKSDIDHLFMEISKFQNLHLNKIKNISDKKVCQLLLDYLGEINLKLVEIRDGMEIQ